MFTTPPIVLSGHEAAIYALIPHDKGVLSGGGDGWIVYWEPTLSTDGKLVAKLEDRVFCLLTPTLSSKEDQAKTLVCGTLSGDLYWLDLSGSRSPRRWKFHGDGIYGLLQHKEYLLVVGGDGRLSRWSVESEEMIDFVQVDSVRLRSIIYLKKSGLVAVGTGNGDIHLLNPETLRTVHTLEKAHNLTVFSMLDAGDKFYSAGRDGAIRWWNSSAPFGQIGFVPAHGSTVNQLCLISDTAYLSPDQASSAKLGFIEHLVSVGRDREIRIWTFAKDQLVLAKALIAARNGGHVASVNACCFAQDGLFTAGDDRTIRYWVQD